LKGYLSGRSTRTFHIPPSYGAIRKKNIKTIIKIIVPSIHINYHDDITSRRDTKNKYSRVS